MVRKELTATQKAAIADEVAKLEGAKESLEVTQELSNVGNKLAFVSKQGKLDFIKESNELNSNIAFEESDIYQNTKWYAKFLFFMSGWGLLGVVVVSAILPTVTFFATGSAGATQYALMNGRNVGWDLARLGAQGVEQGVNRIVGPEQGAQPLAIQHGQPVANPEIQNGPAGNPLQIENVAERAVGEVPAEGEALNLAGEGQGQGAAQGLENFPDYNFDQGAQGDIHNALGPQLNQNALGGRRSRQTKKLMRYRKTRRTGNKTRKNKKQKKQTKKRRRQIKNKKNTKRN
jgi:hypothetical protein